MPIAQHIWEPGELSLWLLRRVLMDSATRISLPKVGFVKDKSECASMLGL